LLNIFNFFSRASKIYGSKIELSGVLIFTCLVVGANIGVWYGSQFLDWWIEEIIFWGTIAFIFSLYQFAYKKSEHQYPVVDVGLCPKCKVPLLSVVASYRCEKCGGEWNPPEP
jgi:hypothetical protein